MSSAGRAANSNGCVSKPKEHATGLIGFAAQIRRSSLIGSCAMETAEHREPCESRGSRTDLGAPGGEIPPGDSTMATNFSLGPDVSFRGEAEVGRAAKPAASVENDRAARLAAIRAGESPANRRSPVAVVVISSNGEGDRSVESLEVKSPRRLGVPV